VLTIIGYAVATIVGLVVLLFLGHLAYHFIVGLKEGPPSAGVSEEPDLGGPAGRRAVEAFGRGDPSVLVSLLRSGDPDPIDSRAFWLVALGEVLDLEQAEAWVQREPNEPLAWLVVGFACVEQAKRARGADRAHTVSREEWKDWFAWMAEAEEAFARAIELDPRDPTPWWGLIQTALGLPVPMAEAEARFEELLARDPAHTFGFTQMLSYCTKKWHGSHEAMFAVVRRARESAPDGSDLHLVPFRAHIERWLYARHFDDDVEGAERYLADPAVRAELEQAHDAFNRAPSERRATIHGRNAAAVWFYLTGDDARLKRELERIGPRWTFPWDYIGGVTAWKKARRRVGLR